MIELGSEGEQVTVILAEGGDFVVTLVATDPWPAGSGITLRLSNGTGTLVTWTAVIAGTDAVFNIPTVQVQAVIASELAFARLYYTPAGGGPLLWAHGGIRVI